MTGIEVALTALVTLVVGGLIGAAGVGGVLLAPWLVHGVGMPVQQAVGIAMMGFVGPGVAAWATASRAAPDGAPPPRGMVLATAPGALAGALAFAAMPERAALVVLAAAVAFVGLRLLARPVEPAGAAVAAMPGGADGIGTGLAVGFGSALTVTSGAVVLTPLLLVRGVPLPEVIVASQLVQLPIAASATAVNLAVAEVPVAAGIAVACLLVPGMLAGRRLGARLPRAAIARLVGGLLLLAAVLSLAKALC